jgi:hypothetical protein
MIPARIIPSQLHLSFGSRQCGGSRANAVSGICQQLNSDTIKHLQPFEHLLDNTRITLEQTAERIFGHWLKNDKEAM